MANLLLPKISPQGQYAERCEETGFSPVSFLNGFDQSYPEEKNEDRDIHEVDIFHAFISAAPEGPAPG